MTRGALAALLLAACSCPEEQYGYECGAFASYVASPALERVTDGGVTYQGALAAATLDEYTSQVEACLGQSVDRSSFVVLLADDWYPTPAACVSPDWGVQQLLPVTGGDYGCLLKGIQPTPECPCRWRAGINGDVFVETPDLLLYKDTLIRWTLHTSDPWSAELAPCATP